MGSYRSQWYRELFEEPNDASGGQRRAAGRRLLVRQEASPIGTVERSEDFHRAIQLQRWIESMKNVVPTRIRGMVLRSLSLIIRPDSSSFRVPEEAPLAGLDPRGFIEQLHRPDGGTIAKVSGIGPATIEELRRTLPQPGDPHIPSYTPAAQTASASQRVSEDLAGTLLKELWVYLDEQERLRLVELAVDLVITRVHEQETHEVLEEQELAGSVKRRIEEIRSADGSRHDIV